MTALPPRPPACRGKKIQNFFRLDKALIGQNEDQRFERRYQDGKGSGAHEVFSRSAEGSSPQDLEALHREWRCGASFFI